MKPRSVMGAAAVLALLASLALVAGDAKRWEFNRFEQWTKGTLDGLELSSTGELKPAWAVESKSAEGEGVWSLALGRSGEVFLGTGNHGKLLVSSGGAIKEVFATEKVAITRLRMDRNGNLWFSAIPNGTIFRRSPGGEVKKVIETGENYVWDFLVEGGGLIVATGPKGRVLRYSESGDKKEVIETGETNVMTLLRGGDGKLYAGTSDRGLVLEIRDGQALVVRDFDEREVRALAWVGEGKAGTLVAALNQDAGARPPDVGPPPSMSRPSGGGGGDQGDDEDDDDAKGPPGPSGPPPMMPSQPAPSGGGKVSGAVYALTSQGGARKFLDLPNRAALDLAVVGPDVFVATDQEGKVFRGRPDSAEYAIALDLPPAQALSMIADNKGLLYLGTGSPAALVTVKRARPEKASYTTQVLDAGFPARFGAVDYLADGAVRILSRSGNVSDPKRGWSNWSDAGSGKPAALQSPAARFLQVKIEWPAGAETELRYLSIPYRALNQPHYIDLVAVDGADKDSGGSPPPGGPPRPGNPDAGGPGPHQTIRKIAWKVTNLDDDPLEFTLFFQPDGVTQWIPIKTTDVLTKPLFAWETASIPDGWYRIKVTATDAPGNPPEEAITATGTSERFIVDNTAPEVRGLAVSGKTVSGKAVDALSAVAGLQYSIDGGPWTKIAADDGVLDSPDESFKFALPDTLAPGPHVLMVRVWDRGLNQGSAQIVFGKGK